MKSTACAMTLIFTTAHSVAMSRLSSITAAACVVVVLTAILLWLRPQSPGYRGRTVEEWFNIYTRRRADAYPQLPPLAPAELANAASAFVAMGTNAVAYLAGRINQNQDYAKVTLWRFKNRQRIPTFLEDRLPRMPNKIGEGMDAAELLAVHIKPPGEMLLPLIDPALRGTNSGQRAMALLALRGISSGYGLTRLHLAAGLSDTNGQIQKLSAIAIRWHGQNGKWAISNLLVAAHTSDEETLSHMLQALNELGTNALPIVPELRQMLTLETSEGKRQIIANTIDYILR